MTTQPTDATRRGACRAACAAAPSTCPATPATTPPACRGTSPSTSVPPPSPTRPTPTRSPRSSGPPPAPGCGSRRRAPATTPARSATLDDVVLLRTSAMTGVDRRPRARAPPGSRPARSGSTSSRRPRRTASPPCTAPRPTSASSATPSAAASAGTPARSACQTNSVTAVELVTADGTPRARRRRARTGPVLGAARRRRQLRRRHRAGVRALPDRDGVRRHAGLGPAATPRRCCGAGPPGPRRARRGHHVVPHPAAAAAAGAPAAGPRPPARRRSTARCSATTTTAEAILAPLRALEPEIDTFAPGAGRVAGPAAHGPRGPDAGVSRQRVLSGAARRRDRRVPRGRPGPARARRLLAAELRQLGGALGRPHAGRRRAADARRRSSSLFGVAIAATPEMGRRARPTPRAGRGAGAVGERPAVPELRRGRGRRQHRLRRRRVPAAGVAPPSTPHGSSSPTTRCRRPSGSPSPPSADARPLDGQDAPAHSGRTVTSPRSSRTRTPVSVAPAKRSLGCAQPETGSPMS